MPIRAASTYLELAVSQGVCSRTFVIDSGVCQIGIEHPERTPRESKGH
jgi:hypothetical protein